MKRSITLALALVVVALVVASGYSRAGPSPAVAAPSSSATACLTALKLMNGAVSTMGDAAQGYARLILPAYKAGVANSSADAIVVAENRATAKVRHATALVRTATPYVLACRSA
jgi:hypothetical protein